MRRIVKDVRTILLHSYYNSWYLFVVNKYFERNYLVTNSDYVWLPASYMMLGNITISNDPGFHITRAINMFIGAYRGSGNMQSVSNWAFHHSQLGVMKLKYVQSQAWRQGNPRNSPESAIRSRSISWRLKLWNMATKSKKIRVLNY